MTLCPFHAEAPLSTVFEKVEATRLVVIEDDGIRRTLPVCDEHNGRTITDPLSDQTFYVIDSRPIADPVGCCP
jgi:hypothetical protein